MSRITLRHTALVLGTACLLAGNAMADQGELYPQAPQPFQSMRSRADVQAEAMNAPRVNNGGTGVLTVQSQTTRDAVRQQASVATRNGSAMYGEVERKR